jgi:flagellar hook-associated protein 1 FlgK
MSLDAGLSVAASGLRNVNQHLSVVAQNVANAGTPGYARQVLGQTSLAAEGLGMGVRTGVAAREIDLQMQSAALRQGAAVAGLEVRQAALARVEAAHGGVAQGGDLPALLARMEASFSALATDPASQATQRATASAADALARQVNALGAEYTALRQEAQDTLVRDVAALNAALRQIGTLGTRIVQDRALGLSTADLENQRDTARQEVARLVDARFIEQPDGDLLVATSSGVALPTRFGTDPFAIDEATLDATATYPAGGAPAVTLRGTDVTPGLRGGTIGATLALRDQVLPRFQAELDEFAYTLATRFDAQGLRLFTDPAGAVPTTGVPVQAGYVGYAGTMRLNAAIATDPALLRDGTHAVPDTPGGPTAFTPNPAGGPAGFTTLAQRVLDFALGTEVRPGTLHPAPSSTGLGPAGTLAAGFRPQGRLGDVATALVTAQVQELGATEESLAGARTLRATLDDRLAQSSAVSIDTEMTRMVQLQGAYAANARIIAAVQAMMDQVLQMVR